MDDLQQCVEPARERLTGISQEMIDRDGVAAERGI
jgi:hypothetical protein